ncbi:MAG: MotA/TolQ/ExbB proton channel family protein [Planctomycetota bacterium]|nr:MotA/TolQ/ExbB proton channel family protein [Planctomycetota bacterium]
MTRRRFDGNTGRTIRALAVALVLAGSALAAEEGGAAATAAAGTEESGETVFSLVLKGGWLMIPIGVCSLVIVTVAIERAISLRRARTIPPNLLENVYSTLPDHGATRSQQRIAAGELEDSDSILGFVLRAGVRKVHRGQVMTESFLGEAAAKHFHRLKRKLRPFSVIASLAPLLGLLGTIYGMITCFENAAAADAAARAESLALGIYSALVTTAAGLSVAIPALVLYHFYEGRVDRIADAVEETAGDFLEHYFGEKRDSVPSPAPEPAPRRPEPRAPEAAHRKA